MSDSESPTAALADSAAESTSATVASQPVVALVGNPNSGKTTLFNRLTGLKAKTANYPGITVDLRQGVVTLGGTEVLLTDLPGTYSLDPISPEERVTSNVLRGEHDSATPDLVLLVLDATHLERHLYLASEVLDLQRNTLVVLNLIDEADAAGIDTDTDALTEKLGCPVVAVSARTGDGLDELESAVAARLAPPALPILNSDHVSCTVGCTGCHHAARFDWADSVAGAVQEKPPESTPRSSRLDAVLTHPVGGVLAFVAIMLGVFYLIFSLASLPMDLIDQAFGTLAEYASAAVPEGWNRWAWLPIGTFVAFGVTVGALYASGVKLGTKMWIGVGLLSLAVGLLPLEDFRSLLTDGVVAGVGGVLVFLPQICILFFIIALLEDSGYMARAAFVMERLMRAVGLPGKAFVPMLSAHACAIPGIMAARVIDSARDRLVTILVLPLLTCSARLPVYAMVTALLFADQPATAAAVFAGAYLLGIGAALASAFVLKQTILPGEPLPLVIELPPYRRPQLRNALATVLDRGLIFVRQAGGVILLISVVLWVLATYPRVPESEVLAGSDEAVQQQALEYSVAGRAGKALEPVFDPLGFDWRINIGVLTSFAARETLVSTLAIVYGLGDDEDAPLVETIRNARGADGGPAFTIATGMSLLVFFVLAMQCLPTQAVTKRETGSWKWAILQLVYMSALAWVAALLTYQGCVAFGLGA